MLWLHRKFKSVCKFELIHETSKLVGNKTYSQKSAALESRELVHWVPEDRASSQHPGLVTYNSF